MALIFALTMYSSKARRGDWVTLWKDGQRRWRHRNTCRHRVGNIRAASSWQNSGGL